MGFSCDAAQSALQQAGRQGFGTALKLLMDYGCVAASTPSEPRRGKVVVCVDYGSLAGEPAEPAALGAIRCLSTARSTRGAVSRAQVDARLASPARASAACLQQEKGCGAAAQKQQPAAPQGPCGAAPVAAEEKSPAAGAPQSREAAQEAESRSNPSGQVSDGLPVAHANAPEAPPTPLGPLQSERLVMPAMVALPAPTSIEVPASPGSLKPGALCKRKRTGSGEEAVAHRRRVLAKTRPACPTLDNFSTKAEELRAWMARVGVLPWARAACPKERALGAFVARARAAGCNGLLGRDEVALLDSIPGWKWGKSRPGCKAGACQEQPAAESMEEEAGVNKRLRLEMQKLGSELDRQACPAGRRALLRRWQLAYHPDKNPGSEEAMPIFRWVQSCWDREFRGAGEPEAGSAETDWDLPDGCEA